MSKKTSVILMRGRPDFRRVMRDEEGKPLLDEAGAERVLKFAPGVPVELTAEELEAVRDDVGPALQIAKVDEKAEPVPKADGEATRKFVEETRKLREKQAAERLKEKESATPAAKLSRAAAPAPAAAHKADLEKK